MSKMIRLGVIGVGNMGTSHVKNILKGDCTDFVVTAVADIDEARLDSSLIAFAGKIVLTLGIDISEVITDGIENVLDQNTDAEAEVEAEVA